MWKGLIDESSEHCVERFSGKAEMAAV